MKKIIQLLLLLPALSFSQVVIKATDSGVKKYESMTEGSDCDWCDGKIDLGIFSASSTLKPQGKASYDIKNINDKNLETVWSEGDASYGIGESFEVIISGETEFGTKTRDGFKNRFAVMNGYFKSEAAFKNNSRVKSLKVYLNNFQIGTIQLLDIRAFQIFDLTPAAKLKVGDRLKFEIETVYPGLLYKDVIITEFLGIHEYLD